jgi:hypothetical protein
MDSYPETKTDPGPEMAAGAWQQEADRPPPLPRYITDPTIACPDDVAVWFREMIDAGQPFHPESSLTEYGIPAPDATRMDAAMRKAWDFFRDPCALSCAIHPGIPSRVQA